MADKGNLKLDQPADLKNLQNPTNDPKSITAINNNPEKMNMKVRMSASDTVEAIFSRVSSLISNNISKRIAGFPKDTKTDETNSEIKSDHSSDLNNSQIKSDHSSDLNNSQVKSDHSSDLNNSQVKSDHSSDLNNSQNPPNYLNNNVAIKSMLEKMGMKESTQISNIVERIPQRVSSLFSSLSNTASKFAASLPKDVKTDKTNSKIESDINNSPNPPNYPNSKAAEKTLENMEVKESLHISKTVERIPSPVSPLISNSPASKLASGFPEDTERYETDSKIKSVKSPNVNIPQNPPGHLNNDYIKNILENMNMEESIYISKSFELIPPRVSFLLSENTASKLTSGLPENTKTDETESKIKSSQSPDRNKS